MRHNDPAVTWSWRIRAALLTLIGVLAVHAGRYEIAPPAHAHEFGAAHAYFTWLVPVAGALLVLAVLQVGAAIRRGVGDAPALPRGRTLWAVATLTVLGVLTAQELLETWVTHGHVPSLAAVFGAGGWVAAPLAAVAAAVIALVLRGAAEAVRRALARALDRPRAHAPRAARPVLDLLVPRSSQLARHVAGRAPPR